MKQVIIGVMLAVLLVGCGEKPKFSINETDTLETYDNNPVFTKVKLSDDKIADDYGFGYEFTSVPISVYGIETSDLDVLGGSIQFRGKSALNIMLTIKGKENFGKLEERSNKLNGFDCNKTTFGESKTLQCRSSYSDQDRIMLIVHYNPFADIVAYNYMKLPN